MISDLHFYPIVPSLGGDVEDTNPSDDENQKKSIDDLRSAGIAPGVAQGNSGFIRGISSPACISSAIAVGATNNADNVTNFSNSSRLIDFWAPGNQILSSTPGGRGLVIRTKSSNSNGTWIALSQHLGDGPGVHTYPTLTGDVDGDGRTDLIFVGQGWSGAGLNVRVKQSIFP